MKETFVTKGGITVIRDKEALPIAKAMGHIYKHIDQAKGCILASDYDYPGRYSRWDIGFVDPPLEMVSLGRHFELRALNRRGVILLGMLGEAVTKHPHVAESEVRDEAITGEDRKSVV